MPQICSYNNKFWFANNLFNKSFMIQKHSQWNYNISYKTTVQISKSNLKNLESSQKPLYYLSVCNPVALFSSSKRWTTHL